MTKFEHLKQAILSLSQHSDWDKAVLEWRLFEVYLNEQTQRCLCTHNPIKEICVLEHRVSLVRVEVGNCCVTRFMGLPSGTIFDAIKRISKNPLAALNKESIEFFTQKQLLTAWENVFYTDTVRRRNLSEKQGQIRERINKKVLSHLSTKRVSIPRPPTLPASQVEEPTTEMTMYFSYGGRGRPEFNSYFTTFAAIKAGMRTSTLRKATWYHQHPEHYQALKCLKAGALIRFWAGRKVGNGKFLLVRLIHPVVELNRDLTGDELERLSRVEGWSVEYLLEMGYGQPRNILNLRFEVVPDNE